jgi:hypothetical protein
MTRDSASLRRGSLCPATIRRTSEASRSSATSGSTAGVAGVPLRLDDDVADLDRPRLDDERRTDLADDEVVFGTVEKERTQLPLGA